MYTDFPFLVYYRIDIFKYLIWSRCPDFNISFLTLYLLVLQFIVYMVEYYVLSHCTIKTHPITQTCPVSFFVFLFCCLFLFDFVFFSDRLVDGIGNGYGQQSQYLVTALKQPPLFIIHTSSFCNKPMILNFKDREK